MRLQSVDLILVVDDQSDVQCALQLLLKAEGLACVCASHPQEALASARTHAPTLVIMDLNYTRDTTSGSEGLDLLARLREIDTHLPVVVMTAWGSVDLAVEAMRRGANDFIEKPWDNSRLSAVIRNQLALASARRATAHLQQENALLRRDAEPSFIAHSATMHTLLERLDRVAPTDANVLILGENGTGKGVLATLLHARSRRASQPLIKVNMGGIVETMFESELFGHVRGAFTDAKQDRIGRFELANGGTLFLDEIGNIPLSQQPKLLRVLEDRELERLGSSRTLQLDVRLVSATNAEIDTEVAQGRFRRDLLYRLNTVELHLPPLCERRDDILPMARAFLVHSAARYRRDTLTLSPRAEHALLTYSWPGNVRELSHAIERAALMARNSQIAPEDLALGPHVEASAAGLPSVDNSLNLDAAEEHLVRQALQRQNGNVLQAAAALGISRAALYRRMERYGLQPS